MIGKIQATNLVGFCSDEARANRVGIGKDVASFQLGS